MLAPKVRRIASHAACAKCHTFGIVENKMQTVILYWGYLGIMENKMPTIISHWEKRMYSAANLHVAGCGGRTRRKSLCPATATCGGPESARHGCKVGYSSRTAKCLTAEGTDTFQGRKAFCCGCALSGILCLHGTAATEKVLRHPGT